MSNASLEGSTEYKNSSLQLADAHRSFPSTTVHLAPSKHRSPVSTITSVWSLKHSIKCRRGDLATSALRGSRRYHSTSHLTHFLDPGVGMPAPWADVPVSTFAWSPAHCRPPSRWSLRRRTVPGLSDVAATRGRLTEGRCLRHWDPGGL